ncbi:hypothetical protein Tco_0377046 [Tanacetum coccineum]
MMGNRKLFSTYKAYNGGNVIFGSNLCGNIIGKGHICDNKCRITFSEHDSEITKDDKVIEFSSIVVGQTSAIQELPVGNRLHLSIVDDYSSKNVSEVEPKKVRKNNDAPIIEDWVSDDEEQDGCPKTSHPSAHKHMAPKAVLMKSGLKSFNTARPVNTVRSVNTGRPFSTARFNDVKASACWVWKPKNKVIDHVSKYNNASVTLKRLDYIDAQGRFKSVMAWMDAQTHGRQECSKEKEESKEECSKSRKTKKMKLLNQSVNTARITAVGEKVNAAESLLVVSTEVNAN